MTETAPVPLTRDPELDHADFLAECERMGVPAHVAAKAREKSAAFGNKWWNSVQRAPGKKDNSMDDAKYQTEVKILNDHTAAPLPRDVAASAQYLLRSTKAEALDALRSSRGDTTNPRFLNSLKALSSLYLGTKDQRDSAQEHALFEGTWLTLSRPNFRDCLGQNRRGDFLYTLGRMSFDMFRPTELRCSIQKITSKTRRVGAGDFIPENVPRSLRKEMEDLHEAMRESGTIDVGDGPILRTYDIEVEFSIEPKDDSNGGNNDDCDSCASNEEADAKETYRAPSKPLRAKMTSYGYMLPDPEDPVRLTVWFTGGVVTPVRETGEEDAEKKKKKKKKSRSSPEADNKSSLGSIDETATGVCEVCCPLLLHECRRKNRECPLHGQKKLSREYRHKMKKSVSRYVRPRIHGTYVPTTTGLSVGDMADAPFSSEWEDIFAPEDNWRRKTWSESAKLLAAKVILGADVPDRMEDDGSMSFKLNRPIGGHIDTLYLDQDMRITKGNLGAIFVHVRDNANMPRMASSQPKARAVETEAAVRPTVKNYAGPRPWQQEETTFERAQ